MILSKIRRGRQFLLGLLVLILTLGCGNPSSSNPELEIIQIRIKVIDESIQDTLRLDLYSYERNWTAAAELRDSVSAEIKCLTCPPYTIRDSQGLPSGSAGPIEVMFTLFKFQDANQRIILASQKLILRNGEIVTLVLPPNRTFKIIWSLIVWGQRRSNEIP